MDINITPLASAAAQRNAFNAAFYELGLRWHWDDECYACALCEEDQRAYLRRYVQAEQPHMLRVYDMEFLVNAILTVKGRHLAGAAVADALNPAVSVNWAALQQREVGF
jgi:hypothetical protein